MFFAVLSTRPRCTTCPIIRPGSSAEPYTDVDHGVVKSGKEAQVNLVERFGDDGRTCLIARKRYLPRHVTQKGQLEAMGVQRSSAFRHDVQYREGRQFRKSRDRRAIDRMSTYGKKLLQDRWTGTEHEVMSKLWHAGVSVPYPIAFADDVFDLEYVGGWEMAAPQLSAARLTPPQLADAFEQLLVGLRAITAVRHLPWRPVGVQPAVVARSGCGSSTSRSRSTSRPTCRASTSSIGTCSTCAAGSSAVGSIVDAEEVFADLLSFL